MGGFKRQDVPKPKDSNPLSPVAARVGSTQIHRMCSLRKSKRE